MYVGRETCPDTGRKHYQGYIRFANPRALGGMKKLHGTAHWEPCKGTEQQNIKYCSKEGDLIIEYGVRAKVKNPNQGKRTDIHVVRKMIVEEKACMRDVLMVASSIQSIKVAEVMLKYFENGREKETEVYWIYGPSGTGKTRSAKACCRDLWMAHSTGQWFDGYDGHYDVIIDDFDEKWCPYKMFLRLTDRYTLQVPTKGGFRQWKPSRIFITCDEPPHVIASKWGANKPNDLVQIGRRINTIYYIPEDGVTYGAPGSTIGIEPSVEEKFPEQGPEQKVWGNTTEAPSPIIATDEEPPVLTHPQTDLPHVNPCGQEHDEDEECIECLCGININE